MWRRHRELLWALALAVGSFCMLAEDEARADPEPVVAPPAHPTTLDQAQEIPLGEKRRPQDYDGRKKKTSVAEDLLWIPRVLFFPFYFTTDYLVRRPLGAIDAAVEKNDVIERAIDLFTFGPNHNAGIVPTAFVDFGFQPDFGIYFFYDDFLAPYNDLRMAISSGGARWLSAKVADRVPLGLARDADNQLQVSSYLQLEVDGLGRPDLLFFGVGYATDWHNRGKFEERTVGGSGRIHVGLAKGSFFDTWLTVRRYAFTNGECDPIAIGPPQTLDSRAAYCTEGTLLGNVSAGYYPLPAGFEGYAVSKVGARLVLDSRAPRPSAGSGVAIDLRSDLATTFAGKIGSWINYAGSLAGFVDLTGTRRVLGLTVDARLADELTHRFAIPFTELVGAPRSDHIPEDDTMEGFVPGRLLGTSSVSATLHYEWPVWTFADATIQLAVGNSFGHHFEDFKFERNRLSFTTGITSPNHRDHGFNLLVGFGTRPFDEGGAPESVRFLLGSTTGF